MKVKSDALCGPFIEATTLEAVLSEMGKLAVQFGEMLDAFMPPHWLLGLQASQAFNRSKRNWIANFYPDALQMAGS